MNNNQNPEEPNLQPQAEKPIANVVAYEIDYTYIAGFIAAIIAILALVFFLQLSAYSKSKINAIHVALVTELDESGRIQVQKVDPFKDIELEAKAVYVLDVNKNTSLFAIAEEVQLPLASITKLMTVATVSQYVDPTDTIVIEYASLDEEGDSGLLANEEWTARDLIDFTLMVSSNDGAHALAASAGSIKRIRDSTDAKTPKAAFVREMNALAEEIGLKQTYFLNETGLDPNTITSGGYGSAKDSAYLMAYLFENKPELIESTSKPVREFISNSQFVHVATNTNEVIGSIPSLIASKTGFTDLAGGNLVIIFDAGINRPIVISVLGSSKEGRFNDIKKLVAATITHLSNVYIQK